MTKGGNHRVWRTDPPPNWHLEKCQVRSGEVSSARKFLHQKRRASFFKAPSNKRNILENMLVVVGSRKKGKRDHLSTIWIKGSFATQIHRDCPNPILENWNANQNPSKMDGKSQFVMILLALVTKVLCTENLALTDEWISIAANPPSTRAEVAWFHIHVGFFHQ